MKREIVGASVIIALGFVPWPLPSALAETTQTSPGVHGVTGRVTYSGPPEESRFKFNNYPSSRFCREGTPSELVDGDFRVLRTIEVGAKGGLKGAIVAVTDILDQRFMAEYPGTHVVVEHCSFSSPLTGVIVNGRTLRVENRDADPNDPKHARGVFHTGHFFEMVGRQNTQAGYDAALSTGHMAGRSGTSTTLYNFLLPDKGSRMDRPLKLRKQQEGSFVWLVCDSHEFEQAFFLPVTNPYYAKVADDGTFKIKGVPPGRHRVVAWHPYAGRAEADIFVDELGSAQVNFELRKGEGELRP